MRKVRNAVFETNSSSSHSITIAPKDLKHYIRKAINTRGVKRKTKKKADRSITDTLYVNSEGVCVVHTGEFGWEETSFNDSASKASYCLTWVKANNNEAFLDMLEQVIKNALGAKEVKFEKSGDEYHPWGYIDHQSDDVCSPAFENEAVLESFIFDPNSILRTDNDNH